VLSLDELARRNTSVPCGKYDTMNTYGESYNGNSVRLRILSICVKKYQQAFWRHCHGTVAIFFKPSSSLYLYPLFL
jgi:hypothetical protein